jgi:hypothetical protein
MNESVTCPKCGRPAFATPAKDFKGMPGTIYYHTDDPVDERTYCAVSHKKQELTIPNWHPPQTANGSHGHWTTRRRVKQMTELLVHVHATTERWQKVDVKARLCIVLVYPRRYRVDTDNLYARVKDTVDALKHYLVDDSTEWLDLNVTAVVEKGVKATRISLEEAA